MPNRMPIESVGYRPIALKCRWDGPESGQVADFKVVSQHPQIRALKFLSLHPVNLVSHINGRTETEAVGVERNVWT
jgi:hypothetical protein